MNLGKIKLFIWQPGRQENAKYDKFCFLHFRIGRFGFDGYILHYPKGTRLPLHTDPIDGKMWRLNITLSGKSMFFLKRRGGRSVGWKSTMRRINFFRPDIETHALTAYTQTFKLSLGFAKFNRKPKK